MQISYRYAQHDDIEALLELVTTAYRGEASRVGWTTEADLLEGGRIDSTELTAQIDAENSYILLAVNENTEDILACAHVKDAGNSGYFGMFAVRPNLQNAGIGKAVLDECERIVSEAWNLPLMKMSVIDSRDELIAFYERRGYTRTGKFEPFPYGDERFGIPTRDDLRFEILEKRFR